jgi:UrcA family protein
MIRLSVMLLAASLAAGAAQARAEPAAHRPKASAQKVAYADLDLTKMSDARKLARRIHAAAAEVCRLDGTGDLAGYSEYGRCVSASMDAAVRRIDSPLLTAVMTNQPAAEGKLRVASR